MRLSVVEFTRAMHDPAKEYAPESVFNSRQRVYREADGYAIELQGALISITKDGCTALYSVAAIDVAITAGPDEDSRPHPRCDHKGIGVPGCPTCDVRTKAEGGPRDNHKNKGGRR